MVGRQSHLEEGREFACKPRDGSKLNQIQEHKDRLGKLALCSPEKGDALGSTDATERWRLQQGIERIGKLKWRERDRENRHSNHELVKQRGQR